MYVNPAGPKRRKKVKRKAAAKRRPALRAGARKATPKKRVVKRRVVKKKAAAKKTTRSSRANRKPAKARKKSNPMATKRKPARRKAKRAATKRKKRNPGMSAAKRRAAGKKAAATRKRNAAKRSAAARKAARTRKRKNPASPKKRRAAKRRNPAAKKKSSGKMSAAERSKRIKAGIRRAKRLRSKGGRPTTRKGLMRARQSIRNRRKTSAAKGYQKRWKMRSNSGGIKDAVMKAVPIAAGFLGSKFIAGTGAKYIPGVQSLNVGGYDLSQPAMHALAVGVVHYGTKAKFAPKIVKSNRDGLMLGAGLGLLNSIVQTFAPDQVKELLGMSTAATFAPVTAPAPAAQEGYLTVDGYVTVGDAPPIDDDITLSDYLQVGEFQSEMGMLESELGMIEADLGSVEADLGNVGGFANRHLGGVHRNSMLRPVGHQPMLAPVPARSFTGAVPGVSDSFDNKAGLYTGIFSGGYS